MALIRVVTGNRQGDDKGGKTWGISGGIAYRTH